MKTRYIAILSVTFLVLLLASCSRNQEQITPDIAGTAASMAETIVAVQLTEIGAEKEESADASATPTKAQSTPTATSTVKAVTPTPVAVSEGTDVCLSAHLVSETIPDETIMTAGESFEKTWVLQNTGTCTWTEEFSVYFHHGDQLGTPERMAFPGDVRPGEAFNLTVPMEAPYLPGTYLGFWGLVSGEGESFGPGTSPLIWAKIVIEAPTATPEGLFDLYYPSAEARLLTTGEMGSSLGAGDSQHDYSWQGFVTMNLSNIPLNATVTGVRMVFEGYNTTGTPFDDLGCLGVYAQNYGSIDQGDFYTGTPSGALWSFCSLGEVQAGVSRAGGTAAIKAVQGAVSGLLQLRFQFASQTDNDDVDDVVTLFPILRVEYFVPGE